MVIKFRGKDKKSNWVYGNIVEVPNAAFVIKSVPWDFCRKDPENWKIIEYGNFEYSVVVYSVDHTTIGRFTGFKDIIANSKINNSVRAMIKPTFNI